MAETPAIEPIGTVVARIEAAIVEGIRHPPVAEFGHALVKISDLRRVMTEARRKEL